MDSDGTNSVRSMKRGAIGIGLGLAVVIGDRLLFNDPAPDHFLTIYGGVLVAIGAYYLIRARLI